MAFDESPPFDAMADLFDRFTELMERADPRFSQWLVGQIPAGGGRRALDLGCGAGRHTPHLTRYSEVLAVDTSDRMLAIAAAHRSFPGVVYERRSGLDVTPAADGQFDLVLSVHTLHHMGPADMVLPHVRSLVAPGGVAVLADIVDPGGWHDPQFHVDRAFRMAAVAYNATGDPRAPCDVLRLMLHPQWLDMAADDVPLPRPQFRAVYGKVFSGAVFAEPGPMMAAATWRAPGGPAGAG